MNYAMVEYSVVLIVTAAMLMYTITVGAYKNQIQKVSTTKKEEDP